MPRLIHPMMAAAPAAWLLERGVAPEDFDPSVLKSEGVPVELQRQLLGRVAEVGGERALLGLGTRLLSAKDEPLLFVMLNSASVADFIDKEQRFNRYFHTDHRVRIRELRDDLLELEHTGPREAPQRVESLYVLGLHLTVLRELGYQELVARLPASDTPNQDLLKSERDPLPSGAVHTWHLTWQRFTAKRQPFAGLDELLLKQADPTDLESQQPLDELVLRVLDSDLAHRWTIGDVAKLVGKSSRTLQRELAALDTSFSRLLEQGRVAAAAKLLSDPKRSVTEIGYVCGFADTAHFSRRFKACMGATPSGFRQNAAEARA